MTSVMTATTEVVSSEKSMLELASVEFSGTAVSRMSTMRMIYRVRLLLDLRNLGVDDDAMPPLDFLLDIGGEFRLRVSDDVEADLLAFFLHVRLRQRLDDLAVEELDNGLRRAGRHQHALHGFGLLALDAGFEHGRHIRHRGGTLGRCDGEAAQGAAENLRRRRRQIGEADQRLCGDHRLDHWRAAGIRHARLVELKSKLEQ